MVEAKFQGNWLVLGDVARIGIEGEVEVKGTGSFWASNLLNSVIEFFDRILESGAGYEVWIEPWCLGFWKGEEVGGLIMVNEVVGVAFAKLRVRCLNFIETTVEWQPYKIKISEVEDGRGKIARALACFWKRGED